MANSKTEEIYRNLETGELIEILNKSDITDEAKLIAIGILEERNELPEDKKELKDQLIETIEKEHISTNLDFLKYNTFWPRFFANLIDGIIVSLISFFLFLSTSNIFPKDSETYEYFSNFFPYLYIIFFHGYFGQTIGKMLTGVKVFHQDEVSKITFLQAFYREAIPLGLLLLAYLSSTIIGESGILVVTLFSISGLLIIIWPLLEIITMLTNSKRRALHDFIAGTIVILTK